MNRTYRLVWNRALRTLQVASELTRAQGGVCMGGNSNTPRRHPLALACVAVLGMATFAAPAWSATCPTGTTVLTSASGVDGADGETGNGNDGGVGSNAASGSNLCLESNNQVVGGYGGNGADTGGQGGTGGTGLAGNDFQLANLGRINGGYGGYGYNAAGGAGGTGIHGNGLVLTNSDGGTISGGSGGYSDYAAGGAGGTGILGDNLALTNAGDIHGGAGGWSKYGNGGNGGAGVQGSNLTLTNDGNIEGGRGGYTGYNPGNIRNGNPTDVSGIGGAGGAGIAAIDTSSITNTPDASIVGGEGGMGATTGASTTGYGGTGGTGLTGSGFTLDNQGKVAGGVGGDGYGTYGIAGTNGTGGTGGAAVSGSDFQVENSAAIYGGAGGAGFAFGTATGGTGGAGITGSGFTLDNNGIILGGFGGQGYGYAYSAGGNEAVAIGGAGGAGVHVDNMGGATTTIHNQAHGAIIGGFSGMAGVTYEDSSQTIAGHNGRGGAGISIDGNGTTLVTNAGYIMGGFGIGYGSNCNGGACPASAPGNMGGGGMGGAGIQVSGSGTTNIDNSGQIYGGIAGQGNDSYQTANGAGIAGTGFTLTNSGGIHGGYGTLMTSNNQAAPNTVAGAGISGSGFTVVNTGTIAGGGYGGKYVSSQSGLGPVSMGAAGINATGNANITTSGKIMGSMSSDGTMLADAVDLSGGGNTLTLESGYAFIGHVVSTSGTQNGDTLALGGDTDGSFDVSAIVSAQPGAYSGSVQYYGFAQYAKTGTGTWTLTGTTTATTPWSVNAGTLSVSSDASLGDTSGALTLDGGTLENTASFATARNASIGTHGGTFQTDADLTLSGVISGTGTLTKTGTGTLTLTGTNTWTGGATLSAGTLTGDAASLQGAIANNAALVFAQDDDGTFNGSLSGTGALTKTGDGELVINSDSSAFTGNTTVQAGALIVGDDGHPGASLGGAVSVAKGALLGGFGTVGSLELAGTLAPGHSIGTLHVAGDVTFQPGSTWHIEVMPNGQSDQLDVGGRVTIQGGSAVVLGEKGSWKPDTDYTILSTGGGINGQFDKVTMNLAFLNPTLVYGAHALTLSLRRNSIDFGDVAQTRNQKSVAGFMQNLAPGTPVYDAVVVMTANQARHAFDQLSGEWYASSLTARLHDSRYVREAMNQRLTQADSGQAGTGTARIEGTAGTVWFSGWGQWGDRDGDGNAARMKFNGSGLLVGVDADVGEHVRIGGVLGASQSSIRVDQRTSDGHDKATWLGVYGSAATGSVHWRAGLAYAREKLESNRHLGMAGLAGNAGADPDGHTEQVWVEGTLPFVGAHGRVAPFLNLAHVRVNTDGWREGGSAAALQGENSKAKASLATLGVRGVRNLGSADRPIHLRGSVGWRQSFGSDTPRATMRLDGSAPFTVYGLPLAKHALAVQAGLDFAISGQVSFDLGYSGQFASDARDQGAHMTLKIGF